VKGSAVGDGISLVGVEIVADGFGVNVIGETGVALG